ncbi:hypothetical protein D1007_20827 [Hordeum vulgare]|nr:hypothetical protein D1007_20827 [Hordeum vulgare]
MASRALAALSIQPQLGRPAIRVSARPAGRGRRRRSIMVVRAGGPPSTNVLILAFVLPLSLFVGTLVAAARVADDLDERFLQEVPTYLPRASPPKPLLVCRHVLSSFIQRRTTYVRVLHVQMEINKAILEENEASSEEAADGGGEFVVDGDEAPLPAAEKEQVLVTATGARARNRPKREVY